MDQDICDIVFQLFYCSTLYILLAALKISKLTFSEY